MLTDPGPASEGRPLPSLVPLAIGSPVARSLYDLWVGFHSVELEIKDHQDRLDAAVTVASHLAVRARKRVAIVVPGLDDRSRIIVRASEQLPMSMLACTPVNDATFRLPGGWLPSSLGGHGVKVISDTEAPVELHSSIAVTVRFDSEDGQQPPPSLGRTVYLSAEHRPHHRVQRDHLGLGEMPLDIMLAGAP